MSNALVLQMAQRFGVNENEVMSTLKATAFKGQVTDGQMTALMIVSNQYGLNPWTKEIYAFPDKNNGIVPVVGVDGWSRFINENPQFDGMEFNEADDMAWIECVIYRKDRTHPVKIKEYMSECKRDAGPWKSHPRRMLRHKAMIQCARLAFGYVGIYDLDEAERILEKDMGVAHVDMSAVDAGELIAKVAACENPDELALTWKAGLAEIKAANDMPAYSAFKAAVEAHGKKLKGEIE